MSKVALYYFILAAVVIGKAGHTLYERSLVVHHGFSVSEYHAQQKDLQKQKGQLLTQLAGQRSIIAVSSSSEVAQYTPVSNILTVSAPRNVASLQ